ncbi:MAG TPA: hypothetical protein VK474_07335, partial [Chthoniobacterales bacterium]|nr:hypothetical protein [Chthoniobacterales bacterium]
DNELRSSSFVVFFWESNVSGAPAVGNFGGPKTWVYTVSKGKGLLFKFFSNGLVGLRFRHGSHPEETQKNL